MGSLTLWEILVPVADNNGRRFTVRHHREWDRNVEKVAGGLTVLKAAKKGVWVSPNGKRFMDQMIPVRVACSKRQIENIAALTAAHYKQKAVMFYLLSSRVFIKHYES
jgi:hypothetical protein